MRSRQLGLSFSAFVARSLESALSGGDNGAAQGFHHDRAGRDLFGDDIAAVMREHSMPFVRTSGVAEPDFSLKLANKRGSVAVVLAGSQSMQQAPDAVLGRSILLNGRDEIDAVIVCVPYLWLMSKPFQDIFNRQNIHIATPDSLPELLSRMKAG